jgi:pyruvate,water dikinase
MRKTKVSVAVVIQKMVQSEIAGISFTVHPVTQDHNQMIHEAVYGLGEAIVSGELTPDSYVIHKNDYKTIDINIAPQEKMLVKDKIGSKWIKVLKVKKSKQKLNEKQIIVLTKICQKIEDHYGFSCDIEWGMEKNRFYIVQSRPITTLKN